LAVEKFEGGSFERSVDQGAARIGGAAKQRVAVVAQPQIQDQVFAEVYFVLATDGENIGSQDLVEIGVEGLLIVIA
jgi:hypothetical protein